MAMSYIQKQFSKWYRSYRNNPEGNKLSSYWQKQVTPSYPTRFDSAEDYVKQFDSNRNFVPVTYTWNPSPITHLEAGELKAKLEQVTISGE